MKDLEREVPDREDDEDGDQCGEDDNDDVLELVVEAEQAEPPSHFGEFLLGLHLPVLLRVVVA
ncbi:hypothetical protein D3C83_248900 [compost metagenome]